MENSAQISEAIPQETDLLPLLKDPALRADLLFFIRLAGTYCQMIFWQAFPRSAKRRRKILFEAVERNITGADLKNAFLDPKIRHAQTTDIMSEGFIRLLKDLAAMPVPRPAANEGETRAIRDIFTKGLIQRHGLPWTMEDFTKAVSGLIELRHFLEHYDERIEEDKAGKPDKIPNNKTNAACLYNLGLLLLPQFCNEIEQSAKRLKTAEAKAAAEQMRLIFSAAKKARAEGIKNMFSEARARKNRYEIGKERTKNGKHKNKTQAGRALLSGKWRKYYYGLKLSPNDLRENSFKRYYDFIGEQNFRQIYARLGAPLAERKLRAVTGNPKRQDYIIYADEAKRLSFLQEIVPFYVLLMRLQSLMSFYISEYAEKVGLPASFSGISRTQRRKLENNKGKIKDPQLREIRNAIAHNRLLWQVKNISAPGAAISAAFPIKDIFIAVMRILGKSNPLILSPQMASPKIFYEKALSLLERENCPIWQTEKQEGRAPASIKLNESKASRNKRRDLRNNGVKGKKEERKALRFQLRKIISDLKCAYETVK